jgi:hypothetical protein
MTRADDPGVTRHLRDPREPETSARGAYPGPSAGRERLGRIVCGCQLREAPATGGRRHHHFTAVLRDLAGNVWECEHRHTEQEEAHACARAEYALRASTTAGDSKTDRPA